MCRRVVPTRRACGSRVGRGFSRQVSFAGSGVEGVPFFTGKLDAVGSGKFLDALGPDGANDWNDAGGMAKQPSEGNDAAGGGVFFGELVEGATDFAGAVIFLARQNLLGAIAEVAATQGAPCHGGDLSGETMVESAVFKRSGVGEADFYLVDEQGLLEGVLKQVDLGRGKVADAEVANFARLVQPVKGPGDLGGMHEVVGAMELVEVNGVGVQPLEGGFAGPDNVVRGKIVSVGRSLSGRADAALGGDDGTAAQAFDAVEGFAKNFFGQAVTIDVGKVEKIVAGLVGCDDCVDATGASGGLDTRAVPSAGEPPAAIGQAGSLETAPAKSGGLHWARSI